MSEAERSLEEDVDLLAQVTALSMAVESAERIARVLGVRELTVDSLARFSREVRVRMEHDAKHHGPRIWNEYAERLEAHKRTLFDERVRQLGLDVDGVEFSRDWESVMQVQQKVEQVRRDARKELVRERAEPALLEQVQALMKRPSKLALAAFLRDADLVVVDWREEPEQVVEEIAALLPDELDLELLDADPPLLQFGPRKVELALEHTPADRHRTLLAINDVLRPDFELRFVLGQSSDTLAFALLSTQDWKTLEGRYEKRLSKSFLPLSAEHDVWELDAGYRA